MCGPFDFDPADFGADEIAYHENWHDSGYDHYTAYQEDEDGTHLSWGYDPDGEYDEDADALHPYPPVDE